MSTPFSLAYQRLFRASVVIVSLVACSAPVRTAQAVQQADAHATVQTAIDAMGGAERIEALTSLRITGFGYQNALEQSERPEGPYITQHLLRTELRDVANAQARQHTMTRSLWWPQGNASTLLYADGVFAAERGDQQRPMPPSFSRDVRDDLLTSPERVLLHALAANDLRQEPDIWLQGIQHKVLAFTVDDIPMRVYLHAYSHLPTAVDYVRPSYFDVWGAVTYRVLYSLWQITPHGIRYPYQWDTLHGELPYRSFTITDLTINPGAPADSFAVAEETKTAFAQLAGRPGFRDMALGTPNRPINELADGVIEIPGSWDVVLVQQPDGIVILEAPISSEYSEKILAEVEQRFPGQPIKAAISTSDAWPHISGIRAYVAREIPIYALDLNLPLLQRLVDAPYIYKPDRLEQNRQLPHFLPVAGHIALGEGPNRLDLYPMRGEGGERMLMAYFPEHRLLYGADLIQRQRDGSFFMPQYLSEVVQAAEREGLAVDNAFAMHIGVTPWDEILDAIAEASGSPLTTN